jgi:hypothetical protein
MGTEETHLQITQLGELFPTVVQLASKGFDLLVYDLVGAHIAPLCEGFAADVAVVWPFSSMPSLMGLARSVRVADVIQLY